MIIKTVVITMYVAHKVWWKMNHKERKVGWNKFFEGAKRA